MLFNIRDRETGEQFNHTPEEINDLRARLASKALAPSIRLTSFDNRPHFIREALGSDGKVSLYVHSAVLREYCYRWPLEKIMRQIEGGILTETGGRLHELWIENSKPQPLSEEDQAFLARYPLPTFKLT